MVLAMAIRRSFYCLLCPFDTSLSLILFVWFGLDFSTTLLSGSTRYSMIILYIPHSSPRINHFSFYQRNQDLGGVCLLLVGCGFEAPEAHRKGNICVYTNPGMYTYLQIILYVSIYWYLFYAKHEFMFMSLIAITTRIILTFSLAYLEAPMPTVRNLAPTVCHPFT